MCTVGGPPDVGDLESSLESKEYKCRDCGNSFKGIGRRPMCPSCQSRNVELVE
jgi:rubrerythrin